MSTPSLVDLIDPPRSLSTFGTVSSELQQLLADAERRAEASGGDAPLPSPEEEIEAVLPADVLASLDEPIEGDEDEEVDAAPDRERVRTGPGTPDRDGVAAHAKGTTAGGSKQTTTGSGRASTHERKLASDGPPRAASAMPGATTSGVPPSKTRETRDTQDTPIRGLAQTSPSSGLPTSMPGPTDEDRAQRTEPATPKRRG